MVDGSHGSDIHVLAVPQRLNPRPQMHKVCNTSKPAMYLRFSGRRSSLFGHQRHRRLPAIGPGGLGLGGWNVPHLGFPVLDPGGMFYHERRHHVLMLRWTLPHCGCRRRRGLYIYHPRQVIRAIYLYPFMF